MSNQDFRIVRIAPSFTWLDDDWSWPRPASKWGLSETRWDEYRRLFREAGLIDISVDAAIQPHPPGHSRRPIFRDFVVNVREQLIAGGFISAEDLERDLSAYERQLADPHVVATSCLYFRLHGRVPA